MATSERDSDRSPTLSTSLLPVHGANRKLKGHCGSWASDDVAETSFGVGRCDDGAIGRPVDQRCVPTTPLEGNN